MANADFARVRRYQKPSCDSADYTKKLIFNQYFLLIEQNQLSEVLEKLESVGITDDLLASFIIASIKSLGVLA